MRLERLAICALAASLAACANHSLLTPPQPPPPESRLTPPSKAEQALDAARVHTELAQHYMQQGDLQTAQQKVLLAIQFDAHYAPAYTVLGAIDEKIGDRAGAERNYAQALKLEPDKGGPNNNYGAFLCRTGHAAQAEPYFAKALTDPFYGERDVALTNAGICRWDMHDAAGAQNDFRRALQVNPNNTDAMFQLASLYYDLGDYFHALAFIQRFDTQGHANPAALKLGFDIETRLGNREAASDYRQRLLSQFPDSEQARAFEPMTSP